MESELARHGSAPKSEPKARGTRINAVMRRRRKAAGAREPVGKLTTILRQSARKLAKSANASERKIALEKTEVVRKMDYFLRFVRTRDFERRLLRM